MIKFMGFESQKKMDLGELTISTQDLRIFVGISLETEKMELGDLYHVAGAIAIKSLLSPTVANMPATIFLSGEPTRIEILQARNFLNGFIPTGEEKKTEIRLVNAASGKELKRDAGDKIGSPGPTFATALIAYAFSKDSEAAALRLRTVFFNFLKIVELQKKQKLQKISQVVNKFLQGISPTVPKVLVWIRKEKDQERKSRNMNSDTVEKIMATLKSLNLTAVIMASRPEGVNISNAIDLSEHWEWFDPQSKEDKKIYLFKEDEQNYLLQLYMFDLLLRQHGVIASVGMQSGGMDGAALFLGMPTIWLSLESQEDRDAKAKSGGYRMDKWNHIPHYRNLNITINQHWQQDLKNLLEQCKRDMPSKVCCLK